MKEFNEFISDVEVASPGRINLIGEHIDYNGGHVLPASIDKKIVFKFRKRNDHKISIKSGAYESIFVTDLLHLENKSVSWHSYLTGVLYYFKEICPENLSGFDCIFVSEIPIGSGVSSSAALECGFAKGLKELFNLKISDEEITLICQKAEHNFVGTKCGIMDQYAVINGKANHFLLLDCQTIKSSLIPANLDGYQLILLNTNVSHNLSTSEYNKRTQECKSALEKINITYPEYKFLCDVPAEVIKNYKNQLLVNEYKRALYVSEENERTIKAAKYLMEGEISELGKLLYSSHQGLRDLYKVSCKELDFLVDFTLGLRQVVGARMMGGGFGGCTINLVHENFVQEFLDKIKIAYSQKFNINLATHLVHIHNGVEILK